jgi:hypothetical protein
VLRVPMLSRRDALPRGSSLVLERRRLRPPSKDVRKAIRAAMLMAAPCLSRRICAPREPGRKRRRERRREVPDAAAAAPRCWFLRGSVEVFVDLGMSPLCESLFRRRR